MKTLIRNAPGSEFFGGSDGPVNQTFDGLVGRLSQVEQQASLWLKLLT
jgi:hypothetical protein